MRKFSTDYSYKLEFQDLSEDIDSYITVDATAIDLSIKEHASLDGSVLSEITLKKSQMKPLLDFLYFTYG